MLSPELRKETEKSKGFIEPTPERDSFLIEQIKELTFKLGSLPPGPEKKAVQEELNLKRRLLSPKYRENRPSIKRKRTETVVIGDVQPLAKKGSDPDVQIISETSQSSKPSMKDQLEQQRKLYRM